MADTPIEPSVGDVAMTGVAGINDRAVLGTVGSMVTTGVAGEYAMAVFVTAGALDCQPEPREGAVMLNSGQTGLARDLCTLGVGV